MRWSLRVRYWLWCFLIGEEHGFGPMHCDICGLTHYPATYSEPGPTGKHGWAECHYYKKSREGRV